jgi:hypothetical protein
MTSLSQIVIRTTTTKPVSGQSVDDATASKASRNNDGSVLPRFSERRRIPAQALWLNEYFPSTEDCRIPASDEENPSPALGDSEELRVEDTPFDMMETCLGQCNDEDSKVASLIAGKQSRHVLVDDDSRFDCFRKGDHVKDEAGTGAVESFTPTGD